MGSTTAHARSDTDLIAAVREGDNAAFGLIFARHREAAERLALHLTTRGDADDLVSEAFTRVLAQVQDGRGPETAFRAYLLTTVRRLHVDRFRSARRVDVTDEPTLLDRGEAFVDPAVAGFEQGAAAHAFASLPERWQVALWHVDVEGQRPAEVAPLLGLSAGAVSALLYRAREGLRQAYLQFHLAEATETTCRWTTERLGAHVRSGLAAREAGRVEFHLDTCRRCMGVYLELREVSAGLRGVVGPIVLGGALTGYTTAGAVAQKSWVAVAAESLRAIAGPLPAAGGGVQAAATLAVVGVLATAGTVAAVRGPGVLATQTSPDSASIARDVAGAPAPPQPTEPAETATADEDPDEAASAAAPDSEDADGPEATAPQPDPAEDAQPEDTEPMPESSADPTPDPTTPAPSPAPPSVGQTDFGIAHAEAPLYGRLGQKLVSVDFDARTTGGAAREHEVVATITFDRTVTYRGTRAGQWTCAAADFDRVNTLRCTTRATSAPGPLQVKTQRLGWVHGQVSVTSSPGPDPHAANDTARF